MIDDTRTPAEQQQQAAIQMALRSPIPKLYANGFGFVMSGGDITIVVQQHDMAIATLSGSYEVMKSLSESLRAAISGIEKQAGLQFETSEKIAMKMGGIAEGKRKA